MDLIVEAFTAMPDKRLIVIGDGPDFKKIRSKAGKNITLLGYQPFDILQKHMQSARAFVFAAEEDFGIAPVEAQACGTPVIAFRKGGVRETVLGLGENERPTGVFFLEQTVASVCDAVARFEYNAQEITSENCRKNSLRFSTHRFKAEFSTYLDSQIKIFQQGGRCGK